MEEVAVDPSNQRIHALLHESDSQYRWAWSSLKLYRVRDTERYMRRMSAYWDFLERFYDGVLPDPIDRMRGYQLFPLDEGRIIVAAFDFIHNNDCF